MTKNIERILIETSSDLVIELGRIENSNQSAQSILKSKLQLAHSSIDYLLTIVDDFQSKDLSNYNGILTAIELLKNHQEQ